MKKEFVNKKIVLIVVISIFLILFINLVSAGLLNDVGDFFKKIYDSVKNEENIQGETGELYSASKGADGNNWCNGADINKDGEVSGLDVQILLASGLNIGINCSDENNNCKYMDNGIEYNIDLSGDGRYDEKDIQVINLSWQRNDCYGNCYSLSCEELGKNCGKWSDGCEGYVYCGDCSTNKSCTFNGSCESDICEGADINKDGEVSGYDVQRILALGTDGGKNCSYPNWCEGADINRDGNVDEHDIQKINASWLKTCIQNQTSLACLDSCQEINKSGYYELCNDIIQYQYKDCIIIKDKNVTLDCKGYSINSNLAINGIYSNMPYTSIKNCRIRGRFSNGIYLEKSFGNEVINNTLFGQKTGVSFISISNSKIIGNKINLTSEAALELEYSSHNQIIKNIINNNTGLGILLYNNSNDNIVQKNNLFNNSQFGVQINSSVYNQIENNIIRNNRNFGFYVLEGLNNTFNNNTICKNTLDFFCLNSTNNFGIKNKFDIVINCSDGWPVYGIDYSYCNESLHNLSISLATLKEFYLVGEQINLTDPPEAKKDISYLKESQIEELSRLNAAKIKEFEKLKKLKKEKEKMNEINKTNLIFYFKKITLANNIRLKESLLKKTEKNLNFALKKYNIPKEIQEELDEVNKINPGWIANYNSIFVKSEEYKKKINGLIINESSVKMNLEKDKISYSKENLPDFFDWRNMHGKNYITPVRDQGECGSCWAFGAAAALEGTINAYYNNPEINADLSEQDLVSCFHGSGCDGLSTELIGEIFNYFVLEGIANETCFSYTATNNNCNNKCLNWREGAWKTNSYESIELNKDAIKRALIEKGPVEVGMEVYSDFYSYSGGIYHHTGGLLEGYHAVTIVGYGNYDGIDYWIVKNSWGENWGEDGYFKIFAGECGIDSRFAYVVKNPFYVVSKEKLCEDRDRDGYCNWGLGEKPLEGCPDCDNLIKDCDDSNRNIFNECGLSNESRGNLDIVSSPSNADVYIKDLDTGYYLYRGKTPLLIDLGIGNREIKIKKENYEDNYAISEVRENEITSLDLTLMPIIEFSEQITKDLKNQENPMISGNYIVWNDYRYGFDIFRKSIYLYDIIKEEEKKIKRGHIIGNPSISGNYVVWSDDRDGNSDIYLYDITTNEEKQITNNSENQISPFISGNYIVWGDRKNGNSDIYMFDIATNEEKQITTNSFDQNNPFISGNYIVWGDRKNGNSDIYLYDITTNQEKQITTNSFDQNNPFISGNYIVWSDSRNGNSDIYLYDITTNQEKQITTNPTDQFYPSISGNYIVWSDIRNGNADLYLYDITANEEKQITKLSSGQFEPSISGNYIVWSDNRNNFRVLEGTFPDHNLENYDIYFFDLTQEIKCSNNKRELLEECDGLDDINCDKRACLDNCKCLLAESKIVNNENLILNGDLKMILQKSSIGGWRDVLTVFDKPVSILANGLLKLDSGKDNMGNQVFEGWNNWNVSIFDTGNYKIHVNFEDNEGLTEYEWEFEVV